MTAFQPDGHLTPQALAALASASSGLSELQRLETAEHLAFCDACLDRYTRLLDAPGALLAPRRSCQPALLPRLWARSLRCRASRCAASAAAVALALTLLWGGAAPRLRHDPPSFSRQYYSLSEGLSDSFREAMSQLNALFDGLRSATIIEGGYRL